MGKRLKKLVRGFLVWLLTAPTLTILLRLWREIGRRLRGRPLVITYYHQPDDPYCHLMLQILPKLLANYMVRLEVKIVSAPGLEAIAEPELWRSYARRDCAAIAGFYGLSFPQDARHPSHRAIARAEAILVHHQEADDFFAVALMVSRALWANDEAEIETLRRRFGTVEGFVAERVCALNAMDRFRRGHYLGATLFFAGEWYWGLDRLPWLEERLSTLRATRPEAAVPVLQRRFGQTALPGPPIQALPAPAGGAAATHDLPPVEFFYSFRSPYSYIALERLYDLVDDFGVTLKIRPVPPMVTRGIPLTIAKRLYIVTDAAREARRAQVPFGRIADPLEHWQRAFALFPYAESVGKARTYLQKYGEAVWARGVDIGDDDGLRRIVDAAGLDWAEAQKALAQPSFKSLAEANQAELTRLGLWGVPSFKFGNFSCWGQDRLWLLEAVIAAARAQRPRGAA